MGIRTAHSHAHYHQGNRKAERTDKDPTDWMARFTETDEENSAESGTIVRQMYHDAPGIRGYSPYEPVYARSRYNGRIPFGEVLDQSAVDYMAGRAQTWT